MKRAIIIGASSGLGQEVSKLLLSDGWKIGIAARRSEMLEKIKATKPAAVETAQIDVTSIDAPNKLLELTDRLGGVDLYFHVSGIGKQNPTLQKDIEMNTVATNAMGFTNMIDTMFNYMANNGGGHIAAISSIARTKGLGPAPSYSATKAYQSTYIQALEQLANGRKLNISFTDIRPGFVDTDLLKGGTYPMLLNKHKVAKEIVKALYTKKHICVIDWKYRILTSLWELIPNFIWRRMKLINYHR